MPQPCSWCDHPESAHSADGCDRKITTRHGVQDCPCTRHEDSGRS